MNDRLGRDVFEGHDLYRSTWDKLHFITIVIVLNSVYSLK